MKATRKSRKSRRQSKRRARKRWHEAVIADYAKLLAWPNVERVAIGWKERRGKVSGRMSVKVYVREKLADPAKHVRLPRFADVLLPTVGDHYKKLRIPTDVVWHVPARFCAAPGDFLDPIMGGALIAVPGLETGTVACMVANAAGQRFALTAGHVIQAIQGPVPINIAVMQPPGAPPPPIPPGASPLMGRTAGGFFGDTVQGFVDFALINLTGRNGVSAALDNIPGNGPVLTTAFIVNNHLAVSKFGAVTGRTAAVFAGLVPSIVIEGVTVTNVFEFVGESGRDFGKRGDSGALVISTSAGSNGGLVGLLFAVTSSAPDAPGGRGYVFPLERIPGIKPAL
jgi:hypothetical protein